MTQESAVAAVPEFPRSYVVNLHAEWDKAARERDEARGEIAKLRDALDDERWLLGQAEQELRRLRARLAAAGVPDEVAP
jgi:chromosome segregation ATPase